MKTRCFIFGLFIILFLSVTAVYAQEGGAFSSYLVGTYDMRNAYTVFQIINPTGTGIDVYVAFFDDNENPLICKKYNFSHNRLIEIDVRKLELKPKFGFGVVKIVSLLDKHPFPGLVGFQRQYFAKMSVTESNLASVPGKILDDELKIIMGICK